MFGIINNDIYDMSFYELTDAYIIYSNYMNEISNNNILSNISSQIQVNAIANNIQYYIDANIQYNLTTIRNVISILRNASTNNSNHYIISFYKTYTYNQSISTYVPDTSPAFTSIINSSFAELNDYFATAINNIVSINPPSGLKITNFFVTYINTQISQLIA